MSKIVGKKSKLTSRTGDPLVIRERNLRAEMHEMETQDEDGNVDITRILPSKAFLADFNKLVLDMAILCVQWSLDRDQTTVPASDVEALREMIFGNEDEEEIESTLFD